jgi:hypothetical protein
MEASREDRQTFAGLRGERLKMSSGLPDAESFERSNLYRPHSADFFHCGSAEGGHYLALSLFRPASRRLHESR